MCEYHIGKALCWNVLYYIICLLSFGSVLVRPALGWLPCPILRTRKREIFHGPVLSSWSVCLQWQWTWSLLATLPVFSHLNCFAFVPSLSAQMVFTFQVHVELVSPWLSRQVQHMHFGAINQVSCTSTHALLIQGLPKPHTPGLCKAPCPVAKR